MPEPIEVGFTHDGSKCMVVVTVDPEQLAQGWGSTLSHRMSLYDARLLAMDILDAIGEAEDFDAG